MYRNTTIKQCNTTFNETLSESNNMPSNIPSNEPSPIVLVLLLQTRFESFQQKMQDQDKRIEGLTQRFQNISATLEDLNREVKQSLGKKEVGPSDDSGKTTTSGCCTVSDHQPLPGQEALKIGSSSTTDHEEERTPTTPTDENEERQLSPHEALCDAAYNGDLDVIRKVLSERENRYLVNEFLNFDEVLGEVRMNFQA